MLGVDSNVLVRLLTRDDETQFERARKVVGREADIGAPVFISLLVLLETEWVLRSRYKLAKDEILGAFSDLLDSFDVSFEDESSIAEALFLWKDSPTQFADCLIGAKHRASGCRATISFDAVALRLPGFAAV